MHGLDPDLLSAIARVESDDCSKAVSPAGAAGLMQLMPQTAARFGVNDVFDPVQNALGAARFIDHLEHSRADGDVMTLPELLAAYNAGEGAVARYGGIPPYQETREYVRRVLWIYLLGYVPENAWDSGKVRSAAGTVRRTPRGTVENSDAALLNELARLRRERIHQLSSQRAKQKGDSQ
jgi:SLT domain-containing protein